MHESLLNVDRLLSLCLPRITRINYAPDATTQSQCQGCLTRTTKTAATYTDKDAVRSDWWSPVIEDESQKAQPLWPATATDFQYYDVIVRVRSTARRPSDGRQKDGGLAGHESRHE